MVKEVKIEYTESFDNITDSLINYLASYSDEVDAIERIEYIIDKFEERVISAPLSCPISKTLLELGVTYFREYNLNGYRLLYRVFEDEKTITIEGNAILAHKQDIEKNLIEYCLIYC